MNRRDFLKSAAAAASALTVPTTLLATASPVRVPAGASAAVLTESGFDIRQACQRLDVLLPEMPSLRE